MLNRRRLLWVLAGAALLAAALWGLRPAPLPVATGAVARRAFVLALEEEGRTLARDRFTVYAPAAGRLPRVAWKAGDRVARGQVLATLAPLAAPLLDPRSRQEAEARAGAAEAARDRALAAARSAETARRQAQRERERAEVLAASGALSRQALDRARDEAQEAARALEAARAALHAADHDLEQARAALSPGRGDGTSLDLRAPAEGVLLKVHREHGGEVAVGEPLFDLAGRGALEVVVNVLSPDAVRIRPGMEVRLDRWGGEGLLEGRVRRVEPAAVTKVSALGVEEQRVDVRVDLVSPPEAWTGLGDGYRVEARILLERRPAELLAPAAALFREGEGWAAYALVDGRARKRALRVGPQNGLEAVVLGGLQEGERLILHPGDEIREGVRVRLP